MKSKKAINLICFLLTMMSIIAVSIYNTYTPTCASVHLNKSGKFNTGMGNINTFMAFYNNEQFKSISTRQNLSLSLGWAKGLSIENTNGSALANIDLTSGFTSLRASQLPEGEWTFWLIQNVPGPNRSALPEEGDKLIQVGNFTVANGLGELNTKIDMNNWRNFQIDRAAITRAGQSPLDAMVLMGAPSLMERLQRYPNIVQATSTEETAAAMEELIAKGRQIFLGETFNGNGRTCATCHREERNFTIDAKFIATLPSTDPLFVAEQNPDLAKNFEKPDMMRKFGLFVENADGFDDLDNKFTLRASSSILAISTTLKAPANNMIVDFTVFVPPVFKQRLGWGGDGAPGSGTLREFALGAVVQHMTKTLNRRAGIDFRMPTDEELDALEAFQLSLGRSEDLDIMKLSLTDSLATKGRDLYVKAEPDAGQTKKCMECHFNAGGTVGYDLTKDFCLTCNPSGVNGTFDIGISDLKDVKKFGLPNDGGYGRMVTPDGAFGECFAGVCLKSFNVPSLVEAADTAPFFHNHLIATIEDAVAFYGTKTFDKSSTGQMKLPDGRLDEKIMLNQKETKRIAAFLRIVNALENIRSSIAMELRAKQMNTNDDVQQLIKLTLAETNDALDDLTNGSLVPEAKVLNSTITSLNNAKTLLTNASSSTDLSMKLALIDQAISEHRKARSGLADPLTLPTSFQN